MPEPGLIEVALAATECADRPVADAVTGRPLRWLRLEAAVLLTGALVAYSITGQPWWPVSATILLPDLFAAGYLAGPRFGAFLYNIAHSTAMPAAVAGLGWRLREPLLLALGLIWLAHIGGDRLLGFGLKYDDQFQHTHPCQPGGTP